MNDVHINQKRKNRKWRSKNKYNYGNHEGMKPKLDKLLIALTEMKRNSYEFSIDFLPELVNNIKKL